MMKIGNNYKVAIAFTIMPLVICRFTPVEYHESIMLSFFGFVILCIIIPTIGNVTHNIFANIGRFLGNHAARIILFLVWIIAVLPTGILMKIMKRDRLRLKKTETSSYWVDNKNQNTDYEYQF